MKTTNGQSPKNRSFFPKDVLDAIDNEHGMLWDDESRQILLFQFIADHCDPQAFADYLDGQARAELEEMGATDADAFEEALSRLDSDEFDVEAIRQDFANGNFCPDELPEGAEPYRFVEQIAQNILNGNWTQARAQFARYGDAERLFEHLSESGQDAGRIMLKLQSK